MIELLHPKLLYEKYYANVDKELYEIKINVGGSQHGHYVVDYPWIVKQIPKGVKSVLDVGGGQGALQFYLGRRYFTVNLDRLPYHIWLDPIKKKHKDLRVELIQVDLGDLTVDWSKSTQYDCIVSCSAIEHNLPQYFINCLKNMGKLVKPGGRIIITLPFTEKPEIRKNMITFTDESLEEAGKVAGLKLLNKKNNFKDFSAMLAESRNVFGCEYVPGGVVFVKEEEK